jgi:membrane protein implicated in regulation of membrane protease activity
MLAGVAMVGLACLAAGRVWIAVGAGWSALMFAVLISSAIENIVKGRRLRSKP